MIRDDERGREIKGVRYGGVWQYIPLKSIRSATLDEPANEFLALAISLSSGQTVKKMFNLSSKSELEMLCTKMKELAH